MADWQSFRWPRHVQAGTMLTRTTVNAGARLFGITAEHGALFAGWTERKCAQLDRSQWMMSFTAPDGRTLQWVLRSQLGSGRWRYWHCAASRCRIRYLSVDSAHGAARWTVRKAGDMDGTE